MSKRWLPLSLALLAVSLPAFAQTPAPQNPPATQAQPDYPTVRVGVLSYLQYLTEMENRDGLNAFDVTRAYLNVNGQLSSRLRFRFTPDIRRATDSSLAGTLTLRVKYAFLQLDNLTPRSWIRFGMAQTPWLDFEESVNRYRVQGTMFSEREGLIPGSADLGVGYLSSLPGEYGEFHVGVYNGEGYAQPEANKYKSVQGRITVRPLPGLGLAHFIRLSGFYSAGWYDTDRPRRVGIVMAHYEHPHVVATVQAVGATENPSPTATVNTDRSGWSVFVELRQGPTGWAGLARFDSFDPNDSFADDARQRFIGGVAYWFALNRVRLGLVTTNEQVTYGDADGRADENRLLFQTHVEF